MLEVGTRDLIETFIREYTLNIPTFAPVIFAIGSYVWIWTWTKSQLRLERLLDTNRLSPRPRQLPKDFHETLSAMPFGMRSKTFAVTYRKLDLERSSTRV